MKQLRSTIIRAGLGALYFTGAHHVLRPLLAGAGAVFMLHHVRPARTSDFQPNHHLEITPDFLRATLEHVRALGVDIISMDEMVRRMNARDFGRRFACFTFDDGYRDNRDHALPVMREFDAPLTVYVASEFASGHGKLWWVTLERLIAANDSLDVEIGGVIEHIDTRGTEARQAAFVKLHDWLRNLANDKEIHLALAALCNRYGIDATSACRDLCMTWDELKTFAADPLVTIGAHTVTHCQLAKDTETKAREEIEASRAAIATQLGRAVDHFAYPYGDRSAAGAREFATTRALGFKSAVTTRPGMIFAENAEHLTALPRISLNGNFQDERFLSVLTSGAATAMWNGFRRVDAA
ncbi:MAG: polysaccharide deacetylase [Proteobacteria bacterium SG_bin9]|nr:MAG: polysaccharide deacetylase [Proteobacteria bacterium SG_bin9]